VLPRACEGDVQETSFLFHGPCRTPLFAVRGEWECLRCAVRDEHRRPLSTLGPMNGSDLHGIAVFRQGPLPRGETADVF